MDALMVKPRVVDVVHRLHAWVPRLDSKTNA